MLLLGPSRALGSRKASEHSDLLDMSDGHRGGRRPPRKGMERRMTDLAVAIAYPELVSVFMGTVLNQTGQAVEVIAITMAVFLAISLVISLFMNWFNRRISLVGR